MSETGSGNTKSGFGGEDAAISIIPSVIGFPNKRLAMQGGDVEHKEFYCGSDIENGLCLLKNVLERGEILDYTFFERMFHHVVYKELKISPEEHSFLITEPPLNSTNRKVKLVQTMFETFNVPAVNTVVSGQLAMYASCKQNGIILDVGDGLMHAVPGIDSVIVPSAIIRNDIGGRDITNHLQRLLYQAGYKFETSVEKVILMKEVKEKVCYVSRNYNEEIVKEKHSGHCEINYDLPDCNTIVINNQRFTAPEVLFQPELMGSELPSIQEVVCQSINKCPSKDVKLKNKMFSNIILSGGSTLFPGFAERLKDEIVKLCKHKTQYKPDNKEKLNVDVTAIEDRDTFVWQGGSLISNLSSFKKKWIKQEDYKEYGDIVVEMKKFHI